MNNGLYVGPIISRKSPRWQTKEINGQVLSNAVSAVTVGLYEPYIPPSVGAVMVTATAGAATGAATVIYPGAGCANVVFPVKGRRFYVEITTAGSVYLMLVEDADVRSVAGGQLTLATVAHTLLLQAGSNTAPGQAIAYARGSTLQTIAGDNVRPYFNGVVASGVSVIGAVPDDTFSKINPQLHANGSGGSAHTMPSHLFYPVKGISSTQLLPAGCGVAGAATNPTSSPAYVRMEYLL